MPKIAISYRRTDSDATGRIYDRLVQRYGEESIFRDIDWIPLGADFRKAVDEAIGDADLLIAIVGLQWRGSNEDGTARISQPNDLVRVEIETALKRNVSLIPVLVGGASMPIVTDLPDSIREFSFRNAATVDSGRNFNTDVERLIRSIDRLVDAKKKGNAEAKQKAADTQQAENERKPKAEKEWWEVWETAEKRKLQARSPRRKWFKIAVVLWALAALWWLLYYAAWGDDTPGLLRSKLFCIMWTSEECRLIRETDLKNSPIPAYTPVVWWLGVAAALWGLGIRRRF